MPGSRPTIAASPTRLPPKATPRNPGTPLLHRIFTGLSTETALHSGLVSENATEASNEATVASATELETVRQGQLVSSSTPVTLDKAQPLDRNDRAVRGVLAVFIPRRTI